MAVSDFNAGSYNGGSFKTTLVPGLGRVPIPAYDGDGPYIFVSYAHSDHEIVFPEIKRLNDLGYNVWYDEGITPGNEWPEEIAAAVGKCSVFIVMVTPNSVSRINVRNEINYALSEENPKPFIAVHLQETRLEGGLKLQIGSKQAIHKYDMSDDEFEYKLVKALDGFKLKSSRKTGTDAGTAGTWQTRTTSGGKNTWAAAPHTTKTAGTKSVGKKIGSIVTWVLFWPFKLLGLLWKSRAPVIVKLIPTLLVGLFVFFWSITILMGGIATLVSRNEPGAHGSSGQSSSSSGSDTQVAVPDPGPFSYEAVNGGYSVSANPNKRGSIRGELVIPDSYNGAQVRSIAEKGFEGCTGITSVVVPDSVVTIGAGAFEGCDSIESITVPFLGESESAEGPSAVLGFIFGYETKEGDSGGDTEDGTDFVNDPPPGIPGTVWQYTLRRWYNTRLFYYYYIPDSLTSVTVTRQRGVPTAAFNGCKNLKSIDFTAEGGSKLTIGSASFQGCSGLDSGVITDGELAVDKRFSSIGSYAFRECAGIKRLTVSEYVLKIGVSAFEGCDAIESLTVPFLGESESATGPSAVLGFIFGYETTEGDSGGDTVDGTDYINDKPSGIPGTVWQYTLKRAYNTRLYYYYYIPDSLVSVTVTKQTGIPTAAFNGCGNLKSVVFTAGGGTKLGIGPAAFQGCASLDSGVIESGKLNVGESFSSIGGYAFRNCTTIKELTVSDHVLKIGYSAFEGCDSLESATLPFVGASESAVNQDAVLGYIFGYETEEGDSGGEVEAGTSFINHRPANIPEYVWQFTLRRAYYTRLFYFYHIPDSLTSVTLTKQKSIPTAAFNGCGMLKTVVLPKGYTAGACAFQGCTADISE